MDDCLFCSIVKKEIPVEIVYEDDATIAFLDIKPINKGHTLVIPKKHSRDVLDTDLPTLEAITKTIRIVALAIVKAFDSKDFNIAANNGAIAGQMVFHTHWHIMPRFENDGYELWHGKSYDEGEAQQVAEKIRAEL
ncbi:MAG: HIT family protein [Patescibacteria group bacterium]